MSNGEVVTLASIGNGAALELFQRELEAVIRNIGDPNTSPKEKRQITLKVTISPDEARGIGFASIQVTSKMSSLKPVESTLYFGVDGEGKPLAMMNSGNPFQKSMFDDKSGVDIRPFSSVDGGKSEAKENVRKEVGA